MITINNLFDVFGASFVKKKCCPACEKGCTAFCPDNCLDYYNGIPDYSCGFLRDAYVLRYFPTHKAEIGKLLESNADEVCDFLGLDENPVQPTFLSLGGGPGTDLIAFCDWYRENRDADIVDARLRFYRVDIQDNWKDQYVKLRGVYSGLLSKAFSKIDYVDITNNAFLYTGWPTPTNISSMSYIISELTTRYSYLDSIKYINRLWANLRQKMSPHSVILLNDRPEEKVRNVVQHFVGLVAKDSPYSTVKEYCFSDNFSGIKTVRKKDNRFCDCEISKEHQERYKTKRWCSSYQAILFVDKG